MFGRVGADSPKSSLSGMAVFFCSLCHVSHETKPGWLGYIGDYTTQLYRDNNNNDNDNN